MLLGRVAETVAQQVSETGLDLRLAEHLLDAARQAFEPIADYEEQSLTPRFFSSLRQANQNFADSLSPLPGQTPQDVLMAVQIDTDHGVVGLVTDLPVMHL